MIFRAFSIAVAALSLLSACQTTGGQADPTAVSHSPQYLDRGSFGEFQRSLNRKIYGYEVIPDPTGSAPTPLVEKFEVRSGDCSSQPDWSDCRKDRERSELTHKGRDPIGRTYWYGWSIYIPADFPSIWPVKVALGQWHQEGSHPVWMIQHQQFGIYLDDQVLGATRKYYKLADFREMRGKWTRFEFHVKWSKEDDGFFRAYANGEQVADYSGRTSWENTQFFKYGIYRTYVSRVPGTPTQIVYYANVRRASTREGLLPPAD